MKSDDREKLDDPVGDDGAAGDAEDSETSPETATSAAAADDAGATEEKPRGVSSSTDDESERDKSARPKEPAGKSTKPRELSEEEINSPDLRTIGLLGVIFIVTAASWGSARFACNYHPAQSRPAPPATTQRLAATAKDSAIEIMHRWKTRDYEGALELAKGPVAEQLKKKLAACEAEGAKCVNDRKRLKQMVLTTGVVEEKSDGSAVARVTSRLEDDEERYQIRLEREGPIWRAVSRKKL